MTADAERPGTIPPGAAEAAASDARRLEAFFRSRGHGDDAPDLVQEIFVLLLTREETAAREPGRFRSFLYAIAYRIGANATRRRRSRAFEPLDPAREGRAAAPGPTPEGIALTREKVRRAAAALEALPSDTRRTLLLVADEGRSVAEAATILNVTEEVVRARLSRGRRRLASILEEEP